jgi:L-asparaginase II
MKAGAEGILCFTSRSAGVAGAIKSEDGAARAIAPAAIHLLRVLSLLDDEAVATLERHARPPVLGGGVPNGFLRLRV